MQCISGRPETHRFLSTPSARRATAIIVSVGLILSNFYPRPPRGGRPMLPEQAVRYKEISIHALREEGDASSSMVQM